MGLSLRTSTLFAVTLPHNKVPLEKIERELTLNGGGHYSNVLSGGKIWNRLHSAEKKLLPKYTPEKEGMRSILLPGG